MNGYAPVVPLESHPGAWADPVVRAELVVDAVYLAVLGVLLGIVALRWWLGVAAGDRAAVPVSVTAVVGVALTGLFLVPMLPLPTGRLVAVVWAGAPDRFLSVLLGATPGIVGAIALWRVRSELRGGGDG